LNTIYKISAAVINDRLTHYADNLLGDYQNWSTAGRGTTDNIQIMRQAFQKCYEYEIELHNLFIDFQQAFDTVSRNKMLNRFKEMGIPMKIIRLINMTLHNSKAQIAVEDKLTPTLEINAGVRQGVTTICIII
jgi:hypothetical protein